MYIMPQGVERHLPSMYVVFFFLHMFMGFNNVFIIPLQHKYRYAIIRYVKSNSVRKPINFGPTENDFAMIRRSIIRRSIFFMPKIILQ